jgi:hypothetical protein
LKLSARSCVETTPNSTNFLTARERFKTGSSRRLSPTSLVGRVTRNSARGEYPAK